MKKIYLVYDLNNLTQHELFEAWSTEAGAQARVDELNKDDLGVDWVWNEVEVQDFGGPGNWSK